MAFAPAQKLALGVLFLVALKAAQAGSAQNGCDGALHRGDWDHNPEFPGASAGVAQIATLAEIGLEEGSLAPERLRGKGPELNELRKPGRTVVESAPEDLRPVSKRTGSRRASRLSRDTASVSKANYRRTLKPKFWSLSPVISLLNFEKALAQNPNPVVLGKDNVLRDSVTGQPVNELSQADFLRILQSANGGPLTQQQILEMRQAAQGGNSGGGSGSGGGGGGSGGGGSGGGGSAAFGVAAIIAAASPAVIAGIGAAAARDIAETQANAAVVQTAMRQDEIMHNATVQKETELGKAEIAAGIVGNEQSEKTKRTAMELANVNAERQMALRSANRAADRNFGLQQEAINLEKENAQRMKEYNAKTERLATTLASLKTPATPKAKKTPTPMQNTTQIAAKTNSTAGKTGATKVSLNKAGQLAVARTSRSQVGVTQLAKGSTASSRQRIGVVSSDRAVLARRVAPSSRGVVHATMRDVDESDVSLRQAFSNSSSSDSTHQE